VQYEETDFAFMCRLLAREGISWFYRHGEEKPTLVLSDQVTQYDTRAAKELVYRPHMGAATAAQTVYHVEQKQVSVPDNVMVSAFDPHRPSLKIEERKEGKPSNPDATAPENELYFSLTNQPSPERAAKVAELTLSAYQCRKQIIQAETVDHLLDLGQRVEIAAHPYQPLNHEYIVIGLRHSAQREVEFSTHRAETKQAIQFWAIPAENGFAPKRNPSTVAILGLQTAITTGQSGDDIHTNEHGETSVHFHWDRLRPMDHTSSRMMRTGQIPTGGSMLLPRVGWEVGVTYLEGDADEPIVVSRVYNGQTMPPYELPGNALRSSVQTATTPGDGSSNEIRMSDVKGEEQMFFNASRDMSVDVGHNTTQSVGNDHKIKVGANHSLTVIDSYKGTVGANQTIDISGNHNQNVTTLSVDDVGGNHQASVGGNLTQMIGGDLRRTLKATSELTIGGNCMSATIGAYTLDTKAGFDHKVGAACIEITKGSRSVIVGGAKTEQTSAAKLIITQSTRAVEAGMLSTTVGGAMIVKANGNRSLKAKTAVAETAGGMEKAEAANITIEGQMSVTLTMGGAVISMSPASISVTGANVTLDGNLIQVSPMNLNN
ncbi:MAG TPA: type VI secretion system tip protein TssI/VgrG, partial [Polyangiaceae bacterium]|nr:type VI secretion system tip protein TssI/VgrG [Polyangiaceae bacterium]